MRLFAGEKKTAREKRMKSVVAINAAILSRSHSENGRNHKRGVCKVIIRL
jgi:hypothetical protein